MGRKGSIRTKTHFREGAYCDRKEKLSNTEDNE
jgi:hypothetical protein